MYCDFSFYEQFPAQHQAQYIVLITNIAHWHTHLYAHIKLYQGYSMLAISMVIYIPVSELNSVVVYPDRLLAVQNAILLLATLIIFVYIRRMTTSLEGIFFFCVDLK